MAARIVLTYKDYEVLPADGRRYELHEGELSVTPAPSPRHQKILLNLLRGVDQHVRANHLGEIYVSPIDCILSDTTVLQPDLVFLESGRLDYVTRRGIEGPPTLVLEVLSPSTAQLDRAVKFQLYARHDVPFYWIADPDGRTIEAYQLTGGSFELRGRLEGSSQVALPPFDELALNPADLWA